MGALVAVMQSDAKLMRCQVERLDAHVGLASEAGPRPDAYGFGYFRGNDVLLGKRPSGSPQPLSLAGLAGAVDGEALLVHARQATVGALKDENTHPFRLRRWLFAHDGTVEGFAHLRPRLLESLPEFLRRGVEGETDSEHVFALFLKHLREAGHLDDHDATARQVARALALTVRELEGWGREARASRPSTLNLVATNGRVLAATRRGRPLHYALLEGALPCARHELTLETPESDPRVRAHRQVKAVCLATLLRSTNGFIEVPEGAVVTVERGLQLTVTDLAGALGS